MVSVRNNTSLVSKSFPGTRNNPVVQLDSIVYLNRDRNNAKISWLSSVDPLRGALPWDS